jgi:hypothetical protein
MNRIVPLAAAFILLSAAAVPTVAAAPVVVAAGTTATGAQDPKGKTCTMEQQCHWENFKKICTWVKVCR